MHGKCFSFGKQYETLSGGFDEDNQTSNVMSGYEDADQECRCGERVKAC